MNTQSTDTRTAATVDAGGGVYIDRETATDGALRYRFEFTAGPITLAELRSLREVISTEVYRAERDVVADAVAAVDLTSLTVDEMARMADQQPRPKDFLLGVLERWQMEGDR